MTARVLSVLPFVLLLPLVAACSASPDGGEDVATAQASEALTSAQMFWNPSTKTAVIDAPYSFNPASFSANQTVGGLSINVPFQVAAAAEGYELGPATSVVVSLVTPLTDAASCATGSLSAVVLGSTDGATFTQFGSADIQGQWVPVLGLEERRVTEGLTPVPSPFPHACSLAAVFNLGAHPHLLSLRILAQARQTVPLNAGGTASFPILAKVALNNVQTLPHDYGKKITIPSAAFAAHAYSFSANVANSGVNPAADIVTQITGSYLYCDDPAGCALSSIDHAEGPYSPPGWTSGSTLPGAPKTCPITAQTSGPVTLAGGASTTVTFQDFTSPSCPPCSPKTNMNCANISLQASTQTLDAKQPGETWDVASKSATYNGDASWAY